MLTVCQSSPNARHSGKWRKNTKSWMIPCLVLPYLGRGTQSIQYCFVRPTLLFSFCFILVERIYVFNTASWGKSYPSLHTFLYFTSIFMNLSVHSFVLLFFIHLFEIKEHIPEISITKETFFRSPCSRYLGQDKWRKLQCDKRIGANCNSEH